MQLTITPEDDVCERVERLEDIVDAYGLAETVSALSIVCTEKADHIQTNWQATELAKQWEAISKRLDTVASAAYRRAGLHR